MSSRVVTPTTARSSRIEALRVTLQRVRALSLVEVDDDFVLPSPYAVTTATELLTAAAEGMESDFSRGLPSGDGAGGIRIEWLRNRKEVRLVIPAKPGGRGYLYHEEGDEFETVPEVSAALVRNWLTWLTTE